MHSSFGTMADPKRPREPEVPGEVPDLVQPTEVSKSPFTPIPSLETEFEVVFLHPSREDWPDSHEALIRKAIHVFQLSLEEAVASAVGLAQFMMKVIEPPTLGQDQSGYTFSALVYSTLLHPSLPFWSFRHTQLVEEGAKLLLMLMEDALDGASHICTAFAWPLPTRGHAATKTINILRQRFCGFRLEVIILPY